MPPSQPHSLDLEINGPDGLRVIQRLVGPVTIGRAEGNSVVLKHDDVSRRHAVVEYTAQGLVVKDVSTNGTFLDGKRIQGLTPLPMGRQVKVGPYLLRFRPAGAGPQKVVSGEASVPARAAPEPQAGPSVVAEGAIVVNEELLTERVTSESLALGGANGAGADHEAEVTAVPAPAQKPRTPARPEPVVSADRAPVHRMPTAERDRPPIHRMPTGEHAAPEVAAPAGRPAAQRPPTGEAERPRAVAAAQQAPAAAQQRSAAQQQRAAAQQAHAAQQQRAAAQQAPAAAQQGRQPPPAPRRSAPEAPDPLGGAPARSAQGKAPPDVSDAERDRLKRWLRGLLLEALDLPALRADDVQDKQLAPRVLKLIDELCDEHARELPRGLDRGRLRKELADEVLGLGPLEDLLADDKVSEVMVVDRATIYVEKGGRLTLTDARFSSEDALRSAIERIVTPLGRRIDESTPMVDARLKDGSRVNAIIPPLALRGPCLTIRKFAKRKLELDDLITYGSLDERMSRFLLRSVIARRNILVSGGTGSGKTTLLNVLSTAIPSEERIVTIEDAAELKLAQPHVVSLETRPPNMEGRGEYTIRDLVRNALRMRPDRIIVGECRGGEALDMLQAMNTGHDGSLTTTHANSPEEAVARLETLVLMAGVELPTRAIREQIANSIHVVVQQARFVDGSRKITQISEVVGIDDDGTVKLEPIFEFHRLPGERGHVAGEFRATGYLPSFLHDFITMGLVTDGEYL